MKKLLLAVALVLAFALPVLADTETVTPTVTKTITQTITPTYTPTFSPTVVMNIIAYGDLNVDLEVNTFDGIKEKIIVVNGVTKVVKSGSSAFITKIINVPLNVGSNVIQYIARIFKSGTSGDTFTTASSETTVNSINYWSEDRTKALLESYDFLTGATAEFTSVFPSAVANYGYSVKFAEDRLLLDIKVTSAAAATFRVDVAPNSHNAVGASIVDVGSATALGEARMDGAAGFIYLPAGTYFGVSLTAGANETRTVHYHTVKLSDLAKIKK